MGYSFFEIKDKPEPKKLGNCRYCNDVITGISNTELTDHEKYCLENPRNKIPEKKKELCPYCENDYVNVKRHLKTCSKNPNRSQFQANKSIDIKNLDNKLDEVLKLAKIGIIHVLNEENIILYLKQLSNSKAKLCDFKRHFHENSSFEIDTLIKDLLKRKVLGKNKNRFYFIR